MNIKYNEMIFKVSEDGTKRSAILDAKREGVKGHKKSAKNLIKEIVQKDSTNLVLCGDWTKQGLEFIEVLKFAEKRNLDIVIYTDYDLETFKIKIGQACYQKANNVILTDEAVELNKGMLSLMGGIMIDYYIPKDYFVICGVDENRQVCKIKKVQEDDTFFEEEVDNE